MTNKQQEELINTLHLRFEKNMKRHAGIAWSEIQARLEKNQNSLQVLYEMEETGGEPDVIGGKNKSGEYTFVDCSPESPAGRRSLCYDREALDGRKENKPKSSATDMAREIGIEILTEEQYKDLQAHGEFDTKTSSWIQTPTNIRKLGGAIFADHPYDHIFVYHNGAESYYASRGFRGVLKI